MAQHTHVCIQSPYVCMLQGGNRPSARAVSLALTNSPYFKAASRYNTSYLLSALGQLVCEWTASIAS
jgi:hypothetical protein